MAKRKAKPKGPTWADLVNRFWGPATPEQMDSLLWCGTCFPAGSVLQVARQLRRLKRLSGGDFDKAMEITHREFDEEFEKYVRPLLEQRRQEEELAEKNRLATQEERAMIAERAFEKYAARGCKNGSAEQDWLEAERELFPWRFTNE